MRPWEALFSEEERAIRDKAGFGGRTEFGRNPALLIIDVTRGFVGNQGKKTIDAVEDFRMACGEDAWEALTSIQKLLFACREKGMPIIYTNGDDITRQFTGGGSTKANPVPLGSVDLSVQDIPEMIAPHPTDLVIHKTKASAFFNTALAVALHHMGVDSLLVTGCTTSGCVRASVVDAFSHGYKLFVVEEGVFDRFPLSHKVSLFDMNAKYADVITLEDALHYVESHQREAIPPPVRRG